MDFHKYESIETIFVRDPNTHKLDFETVRELVWLAVDTWIVTEKVDGTNIRVAVLPDGTLWYGGRNTDAIPTGMKDVLDAIFLPVRDALVQNIPTGAQYVIIYGEGYGTGIKGSEAQEYTKTGKHFSAFDAYVSYETHGHYFDATEFLSLIGKCNIPAVPILGTLAIRDMVYSRESAVATLQKYTSVVAKIHGGNPNKMEGIVCRPLYELKNKWGNRLIWKLTNREFKKK